MFSIIDSHGLYLRSLSKMKEDDSMGHRNANWGKSVAGILIKDNKILLVRHTYGSGRGMLHIPGGYLNYDETSEQALVRECKEEANVDIQPQDIAGIRFNRHDWYVLFFAENISGEVKPDGKENSEALWLDVKEALLRDDVSDLTKKMIEIIEENSYGLKNVPYSGNVRHSPASLYAGLAPKKEI